MRIVRVFSVLIFAIVVLGLGVLPAQAGEECAVAALCPPPTVPAPAPSPAPQPEPQPAPQPQPEPAPAPQPAPAPAPAPSAGDEPASANRLFDLVNKARADRGLAPLTPHADAAAIAFEHSRQMAARHDIWHNDALFTKATKQRLGAKTIAENVAMNGSADGAHERLMASDGHRANILNGTFSVGAVGAVRGDDGRLYVTEIFIEPVAGPRPAPTATTATTAKKPAPAAKAAAAARPASPAPSATAPAETTVPAAEATPAAEPELTLSQDEGDMELAAGLPFAGPVQRGPGLAFVGPAIVLAILALTGVVAALTVVRRRSVLAR